MKLMDGPSIKSCVHTILCGRFKVINEGVGHIFSLPCLWKIKCICCKGAFTNYVNKILPVFDHVCMCVDKIFTLNVDKNRHFSDHVCMSSCPRSL